MTISGKMDKRTKIYINLTNGIEYFERVPDLDPDQVVFMRVQSTHCEQKNWERVFASIPDDMLFRLALGYKVIIVDFSGRRRVPRAIWQGFELMRYVLCRLWFGREYFPPTRAMSDNGVYFAKIYRRLKENRVLRRRLEYFKRFLITDHLDIEYVTGHSTLDARWERIYQIVRWIAGRYASPEGSSTR